MVQLSRLPPSSPSPRRHVPRARLLLSSWRIQMPPLLIKNKVGYRVNEKPPHGTVPCLLLRAASFSTFQRLQQIRNPPARARLLRIREEAGTRAANAGQHRKGKQEQRYISLIGKNAPGFPTSEGKEAGLGMGYRQVLPKAAGTSLASSSDFQAGFLPGLSLQPAPPRTALTNGSKSAGSLPSSDTNSLHILCSSAREVGKTPSHLQRIQEMWRTGSIAAGLE